jgi:hypothetical protein
MARWSRNVAAAIFAWFLAMPMAAAVEVDLQLVLAVDVSRSIDDYEYDLQKRGYAEALEHPAVIQAIASGQHRAIAVTLIEWAGVEYQKVIVPWVVIADGESAHLFTEQLLGAPRAFYGWTSISGAIDFSMRLLESCPHPSTRRVIDISGDGANNSGRAASDARDDALGKGVVINGLVIMNDRPTPGFAWRRSGPPLDEFFRDNVIGGPGAFLIAIQDFESFAHAIRNKLLREISGEVTGPTTARAE